MVTAPLILMGVVNISVCPVGVTMMPDGNPKKRSLCILACTHAWLSGSQVQSCMEPNSMQLDACKVPNSSTIRTCKHHNATDS